MRNSIKELGLEKNSKVLFKNGINWIKDNDLSNIDFIDSSGLGAMVQAAKKFTQSKRAFNVVGNPRVVQTIKLVRLEEFLHLAPDLNTAIGKLSA